MRLIDTDKARDAVLWGCTYVKMINMQTGKAERLFEAENKALEEAAQRIAEIESVDAVEVVRCKDCRFFKGDGLECYWGLNAYEDDYCSHGVRKEEKQ